MKQVIELLKKRNEKIATMESCTGGMFASEITNIAGSSQVFECSLVTYSSKVKMNFGVKKETIAKYTVYSKETAEEMAKGITTISNADWGIGITGHLGDFDPENPMQDENVIYYSIYSAKDRIFYTEELKILQQTLSRKQKKERIVANIIEKLHTILK